MATCPSTVRPGVWDTPLFTGELQCLAKGQYLHLRLIGADDAIFADSVWLDCSTANNPIPLEAFIQGAHDSSRYFIIKVGDPGPKPKRSVALGIGFRERNSAFDLNAAISDRIHLCQKTGAHADEGWGGDDAKETEAAEAKLAAAAQDLSLKDGQRIRVNLKPNKRGTGNPLGLPDDEDEEEEEGGGKAAKGGVKAPAIALVQKGGSLLLAPPPSSESSVQEFEEREKVDKKKGKKSAKKEPAPVVEDDADEFGDFESA